jgi:hypothetical protein
VPGGGYDDFHRRRKFDIDIDIDWLVQDSR